MPAKTDKRTGKKASCPSEITLEVISGRWKMMVIYWLCKASAGSTSCSATWAISPTAPWPNS